MDEDGHPIPQSNAPTQPCMRCDRPAECGVECSFGVKGVGGIEGVVCHDCYKLQFKMSMREWAEPMIEKLKGE